MMQTPLLFTRLISVLLVSFLAACAHKTYNVYNTQGYDIRIDLRGINELEAKQVLDSYFLTYQYQHQENHHVYFMPCPVAEKCKDHLYTMVWVWDTEGGENCSKGVDIYRESENYNFQPEETRCIN